MSFSQITLLGNLTQDPEKSTLPDKETETSRFGVAVNSKKGGEEIVTFYRVNFIGKIAGVANQYLQKGRPVMVIGEPRLETYKKQDGSTGASIEVRGTSLQLVGGRPESAMAAGASGNASPSAAALEDAPF